jgi:L-amino acid N-acyltransferase YncA
MPIRPVQPRDLAVITAIYDDAVRHGTASFELDPPDQAEMARRYETLRAGGYPYVVAEVDGEIMGYAYAAPYRARSAAGSGARCSRGSWPRPKPAASGRCSR